MLGPSALSSPTPNPFVRHEPLREASHGTGLPSVSCPCPSEQVTLLQSLPGPCTGPRVNLEEKQMGTEKLPALPPHTLVPEDHCLARGRLFPPRANKPLTMPSFFLGGDIQFPREARCLGQATFPRSLVRKPGKRFCKASGVTASGGTGKRETHAVPTVNTAVTGPRSVLVTAFPGMPWGFPGPCKSIQSGLPWNGTHVVLLDRSRASPLTTIS